MTTEPTDRAAELQASFEALRKAQEQYDARQISEAEYQRIENKFRQLRTVAASEAISRFLDGGVS